MFLKLITRLQTALSADRGAGMAEYALLLVLVGIAAVTATTALSGSVSGVYTSISDTLTGATPAPAP